VKADVRDYTGLKKAVDDGVAEFGKLDIVSANAGIGAGTHAAWEIDDTPVIQNEPTWRLFRPDLEHPTKADFAPASQALNALPVPWVDPVDVSNAVLYLASDEARYVTGVAFPIDAGAVIK
jgi:NAD(P)-dependent dehydrogenase (short-subunit alcohol dehydrogenase family)